MPTPAELNISSKSSLSHGLSLPPLAGYTEERGIKEETNFLTSLVCFAFGNVGVGISPL